jgi:hypothetical protein
LLGLAVGCAAPTPTPTPRPTPTLTPSATPTPAPTPTATPIPPLVVDILWPEAVSALEPAPVEVAVISPPGVAVTTTVYASLLDPRGETYWQGLLEGAANDPYRYTSGEAVSLPLEPPAGDWRLLVALHAPLPAVGEQTLVFQPVPIPFHDLEGQLTPGIELRIPREFAVVATQGDPWAGGRTWRYEDGAFELWWAPGPAEPLLWNNALALVESTHDPGVEIEITDHQETTWGEQPAFLFRERWGRDDPLPAEALAVQGPDEWLYVLRVRAVAGTEIPMVMHQVRSTFAFETGEE